MFSATTRYLGAALAVLTFDQVEAHGVAWFRMAGAALVVVPWRKPWRADWTRRRLVLVVLLGLTMSTLNTVFYLAVDRLPLGTTVAIELLGPIAVATAFDRRARNLTALGLVGVGVYLLSDVRWEGSAAGVAFALASAASWALYIVISHRVAVDGLGVDGLAAAFVIGTVAGLPVLGPAASAALVSIPLFLTCVAIGIMSDAIPKVLDQVVLSRATPSRFALLQAILPVTAAAIGYLTLTQRPEPVEAAGIALVVVAIAVGDRRT